MEIHQFEDTLEDTSFGEEAPFNPAFLNEPFVEMPKPSKQKTSKARRTGLKSQAAKPASRPAKLAAQSLVQWQYVSPRQLRSRSDQPRQKFEPTALAELAASVRQRGILQPILVRAISAPSSTEVACEAETTYEILAGERRWRASQAAGLTQVPVLVQHLDDEAATQIALIENLQREDLTPLETAGALVQMTQQGYSIRKLATKLGKKRGWVEEHLRLTRLPEELKEMVSGRPDSATHARELEKVNDPYLQAKLITQVRDENLSLSELRRQIRHQEGAAPKVRQARKGKELDREQENITVDNILEGDGADPADAVAETDTPVTVPTSASLKEATPCDQPAALPQPVRLEAECLEKRGNLEEAEDWETEGPGTDGATTVDATPRQLAVKAKLHILLRDLEKLDRPTDPVSLAEMTQLLQEAQRALTVTLERWAA